jgi:hypothetical protein
VARVRLAEVDPDQAAVFVEVVGDPFEREVLDRERAVAPTAGLRILPPDSPIASACPPQ